MSAGILLFIHTSAQSVMEQLVVQMNGSKRVSPEVLSLHLVQPSRGAMHNEAVRLREDPALQDLERIEYLKPNNAVRDLTAPWRLDPGFVETHTLLVNLETVNPEFAQKYPNPNLTLPAGQIEPGETPAQAAHREFLEETRIKVDPALVCGRIGLFRGGITMACVVVTDHTPLTFVNGHLCIGDVQNIDRCYAYIDWQARHRIENGRTPRSLTHAGGGRDSQDGERKRDPV